LRPSTDPNHPEKPQDPDGILNVAYFNAVSRNPDMPATLAEPFRNAIRNIPPQKSRDALLKKMWDISGDFSRYARMPGYAYYTQTPF
jgi:hypothetical protein